MKKYVKPDLYYENFELSQHVATCVWDMPNSNSPDNCAAVSDYGGLDGLTLFTNETICTIVDDNEECYCWTNGGDEKNVFNS